MLLTKEQLGAIYKEAPISRIIAYVDAINESLEKYQINTLPRSRMFLAQIGHESGQLRYTEELATGSDYEGRKDLGNTEVGDGVRYKGRGLLQITGRRNYALCSLGLDLPLLENPELLTQPEYAALSAGWYWYNCNLNSYCDKDDFIGLTRRINGGINGLQDRLMLYERAKQVLT